MRDVEKIVTSHLNVWTVSDPDERAAEIGRVYTDDVTVVEPDGVVHGRAALNKRIGVLQQHFSGLEFLVNGSIHHHHDYAMYEWRQPTAIQSDDIVGWDVLHIRDGLIDQAVMFIPGFDALSVPGHPAETP
jgi:SnoaL-like domain